jgi:hypothetical protein
MCWFVKEKGEQHFHDKVTNHLSFFEHLAKHKCMTRVFYENYQFSIYRYAGHIILVPDYTLALQ